MSAALAAALGQALGRDVVRLDPVAGGDLNDAYAATLADGARMFVKTSADAAPGVALWQLAPLLLHAALFGSSWGERATAVLRRYA